MTSIKSVIVPGKPIFESFNAYNLYAIENPTPLTERKIDVASHTFRRTVRYKSGKDMGTCSSSLTRLREFLKFDDTLICDDLYDTMQFRGDWMYPDWSAPCTFLALIHAYEISRPGIPYNCLYPMAQSLFSLFSKENMSNFGKGLNLFGMDMVAKVLGISFLVIQKNHSSCIGSGTWLENFFIYRDSGHTIPVSVYTVTNRVDFKSTPTGLVLL
jgi:hypothetical protein